MFIFIHFDLFFVALNPAKKDPIKFHERNEQLTREYQIAVENMGIIRRELAHCVRTETVNQFVNCKELREKYWALCTDRFRGMIFPDGIEPNRAVPGLIAPKQTPAFVASRLKDD